MTAETNVNHTRDSSARSQPLSNTMRGREGGSRRSCGQGATAVSSSECLSFHAKTVHVRFHILGIAEIMTSRRIGRTTSCWHYHLPRSAKMQLRSSTILMTYAMIACKGAAPSRDRVQPSWQYWLKVKISAFHGFHCCPMTFPSSLSSCSFLSPSPSLT